MSTLNATTLIDHVQRYANDVLNRCADRYGTQHTPLLIDGLDRQTGAPLQWDGHVLSNLACQQNFLRTLDGLSILSGDDTYRQRADTWIGFALNQLHDPASDMLYWGGHSSYALEANRPLAGNHELKCVYPYYNYLFRLDPERTRRFIEAFWHQHIWDWSTLLFNRHGEYQDWDRTAMWPTQYTGGPLPIIENTALSFINTGSDLIYAAAQHYKHTQDPQALAWASHLLSRYDQIRHPDTGLAGYQFNHREPCRVRQSFHPPYNDNPAINETTVITNNVIRTRYGRATITFLNTCGELDGDNGQDLLDLVCRDLHALATYALDDNGFTPLLADGTHLGPSQTKAGAGYCNPSKLEPVPSNGLLFLAYARAFRHSGDERFHAVAQQLATGMGWDLDNGLATTASPAATEAWSLSGQNDASALFGLIDLYAITGDSEYLGAAQDFCVTLLNHYDADALFSASAQHADIDSALPLALLHLAAVLEQTPTPLPTFYPNLTYFDPKIVIRRQANN
jgi:pectate lyase